LAAPAFLGVQVGSSNVIIFFTAGREKAHSQRSPRSLQRTRRKNKTTFFLQMMRLSANSINSTSRRYFSWLEKTVLKVEEIKCKIQGS